MNTAEDWRTRTRPKAWIEGPEGQKERATAIITDAIAPYTPRETARELADKVIAALGERFDLIERARETILEEVGK